MSPLEIEILLHYHVSPGDWREGDFSAPKCNQVFQRFLDNGLLMKSDKRAYQITKKGEFYVTEGLCKVPLPKQVFVIPAGERVT